MGMLPNGEGKGFRWRLLLVLIYKISFIIENSGKASVCGLFTYCMTVDQLHAVMIANGSYNCD